MRNAINVDYKRILRRYTQRRREDAIALLTQGVRYMKLMLFSDVTCEGVYRMLTTMQGSVFFILFIQSQAMQHESGHKIHPMYVHTIPCGRGGICITP